MTSPTGYSMLSYGGMVTCEPRMSAYAEALRRTITPGCTVIDIGAGPGVFSLLACQYGAGSVVAIEPDDSVELLRQLAIDNGCADRITIFQGLSTDYEPTTKADVIISDIRGCLPLYEGHIPTIADARERLLAPDGKLIPSKDTLRIALVNSAENYAFSEEPWRHNKFGLDLSCGARFASNSWSKVKLEPNDLLGKPINLAVLDYHRVTDTDLASRGALTVEKAGTAHGVLIWFDTELAPGIGYSNAPGEPPLIYGQTFLPFDLAMEVTEGDQVVVDFTANLVDGSYVWGWNSSLYRKGQSEPELCFRQSTFLSKVLAPQSLRTRARDFVPTPREAHALDRLCLSLIDGQRTLADVAEEAYAQFPERFSNAAQALDHVAVLTNRYR